MNDVDRAAACVFTFHADRQVHERVAIEIAGGECRAEPVVGFASPGNTRTILMPALAARTSRPRRGPIEDIHHSRGADRSDRFIRNAHD